MEAPTSRVFVFLIAALTFLPGCGDSSSPLHRPHDPGATLTIVDYEGCKQFDAAALAATPPDQDCVLYEWNGDGTLLLSHVNAGFNCCPGEIIAEIEVVLADYDPGPNLIRITEGETDGMCDCQCLFDVEYRIEDLPPLSYTILFVEPYVGAGEEILAFEVDLGDTVSGSHCVERTRYPWDIVDPPEGPEAVLIGYTGCKGASLSKDPFEITPDMDCIVYDYEWTGVLRITHVNAGFNCCPGEIVADITVSNDTITIGEGETDPKCHCLCLFDVEYEIRNLPPGRYVLRVGELYIQEGDEPLVDRLDLEKTPSCCFCVARNHYPWDEGDTLEEDLERLADMKEAIVRFAGTPACAGDGDCDALPLGAKPCGGPWEYLIYSKSACDDGRLRELTCAYNAVNHAINTRHGLNSDCMIVGPPRIGCRDGECVDLDGQR